MPLALDITSGPELEADWPFSGAGARGPYRSAPAPVIVAVLRNTLLVEFTGAS